MPTNEPYCPSPVAGRPSGRIVSYMREVLGLSHADVRGVGINLEATLSSTTPGTDEYMVPSDQDLVIFSIQGYLRFPTLNSEPTLMLGFLNPDPSERWFVKTQNCLVQLLHKDRSLNVFDARSLPLSAISPPVGATMYFPPETPYILPGSHRIQASFTLQDSTTAIVGSSTAYGVLLTGALVAKGASQR